MSFVSQLIEVVSSRVFKVSSHHHTVTKHYSYSLPHQTSLTVDRNCQDPTASRHSLSHRPTDPPTHALSLSVNQQTLKGNTRQRKP
ncbi:hypothetical protein E2C01_022060 [Portunus trituberculatus]|uniref:Uncharacterized protein n=1 Tax=Portunus trituberculatus TaxID=210409 RepID=A0A5B7E512_PORTR|nr:hypothetical protein [Portunus trituberculatus]